MIFLATKVRVKTSPLWAGESFLPPDLFGWEFYPGQLTSYLAGSAKPIGKTSPLGASGRNFSPLVVLAKLPQVPTIKMVPCKFEAGRQKKGVVGLPCFGSVLSHFRNFSCQLLIILSLTTDTAKSLPGLRFS